MKTYDSCHSICTGFSSSLVGDMFGTRKEIPNTVMFTILYATEYTISALDWNVQPSIVLTTIMSDRPKLTLHSYPWTIYDKQ